MKQIFIVNSVLVLVSVHKIGGKRLQESNVSCLIFTFVHNLASNPSLLALRSAPQNLRYLHAGQLGVFVPSFSGPHLFGLPENRKEKKNYYHFFRTVRPFSISKLMSIEKKKN